jgi:hypothetical protein
MINTATGGIEELLTRLVSVRAAGPGRWMASCPAHQDRRASLSVALGTEGRVLLYCFAACRTDEVLRALDLSWSALFPDGHRRSRPRRVPPGASERERACHEILEREKRAANRRAQWLPHWIAADHVREYSKVAAIVRAYATALGETNTATWPLLDLGAAVEREALNTEAVLDNALGRLG